MGRYIGGLIRSNPLSTSRFGTTSGMFTLGQQLSLLGNGNWPGDTFTTTLIFNNTDTWECPTGVTQIEEYLIVGGGGGGAIGSDTKSGGAGAGAGGLRQGTSFPVTAGQTYTLSVGGGGVGFKGSPVTTTGTNGTNSFIQGGSPAVHIGSNGGGVGGLDGRTEGFNNGGCGGGGYLLAPGPLTGGNSIALTAANGHNQSFVTSGEKQGSNGGTGFIDTYAPAGAGGGAGEDGYSGVPNPAGPNDYTPTVQRKGANGGNGLSSTITGTSKFYSGGGGASGTGRGNLSSPSPIKFGEGGDGGLGGGGSGFGPGLWLLPTAPEAVYSSATNGVANTGGGAGGGIGGSPAPGFPIIAPFAAGSESLREAGKGAEGGSGVIVIKFQNPITNTVFEFNSSTIWKNDIGAKEISYLVIGGGGAGGRGNEQAGGGGGGAGGYVEGTGLSVVPGQSYQIVVGAGGTFHPDTPAAVTTAALVASIGNDSILKSSGLPIVEKRGLGGGGGGMVFGAPNVAEIVALFPELNTGYIGRGGLPGGSGGGGVGSDPGGGGYGTQPRAPDSFGFDGGIGSPGYLAHSGSAGGGGGGGAGALGGFGTTTAGDGGAGKASSITGTPVTRAGGGGGGIDVPMASAGDGGTGGGGSGGGTPGQNGNVGTANTGSGGGGGGWDSVTSNAGVGGTGGSGVVIIKVTG